MISRVFRFPRLAFLILTIFTSVFACFAAGEVDTSFRAALTYPTTGGYGKRILRQPDGKFLVSGYFQAINGFVTANVVRLNADFTVDVTFRAPEIDSPTSVNLMDIALQSTGKILITGRFTTIGGQPRFVLARLNSDGSVDQTFPQVFSNSNNSISKILVLPDDRILIGGFFNIAFSGGVRSYLARLSADGVVDPSFNFTAGEVGSFDVQPDGKLVVGWLSSPPRVGRFNSDGTADTTFAEITLSFNTGTSVIKYLPDGKIIAGGNFTSVNGVSSGRVFRANSDGTIDTTFNAGFLQSDGVLGIIPAPGGGYYVCGWFTARMYRINSNGSRDFSFGFSNQSYSMITEMFLLNDGKIMTLGNGTENFILRLDSSGSDDDNFPSLRNTKPGTGLSVLVQPDNKTIVGGPFTVANGTSRQSMARFNSDGTLDINFFTSGFGNAPIYDLFLQPDGKILVGGNSFGGAQRVNSLGGPEVTFTGTTNYTAVEGLPDGKVLIGGTTLRKHNADGSLDSTLASVGGITGAAIYKIALQPDGKIIINGSFLTVNGTSRNRIARLNADGTLDSSFNPSSGANADVAMVVIQPDGKMLIGGNFTSFNADSTKRFVARLNADGSLDSTFSASVDSAVVDIELQPDGKVILGGSMSTVSGASRRGIARLNANGTLDTTFNTGSGTNSTVWGLGRQSDGKVIYVGEFTVTNGNLTIGIGRLLNTIVTRAAPFDFDGDSKTDVSVFRPAENKWYILQSSNGAVRETTFAVAGDVAVPADYDGDGKTDVAVFRPTNGDWWYLSSINGAQVNVNWGQNGDIPRPGDIDADGKADFVVYRPSNGVWYRMTSTGIQTTVLFGAAGDQPLVGDFDGDGKSDPAVFRPSSGDWWYAASTQGNSHRSVHWGQNGDIPVAGDFDGDNKTDFVVFRPSDGGWYILYSTNTYTITAFGTNGDRPIAADYDGDGKADVAVFRPSTGIWYLLQTTAGFGALQWGLNGDVPAPSAFTP